MVAAGWPEGIDRTPAKGRWLTCAAFTLAFFLSAAAGWQIRNTWHEERLKQAAADNVVATIEHAYATFATSDIVRPEFEPDRFGDFLRFIRPRLQVTFDQAQMGTGTPSFQGARVIAVGGRPAAFLIFRRKTKRLGLIVFARIDGFARHRVQARTRQVPLAIEAWRKYHVVVAGPASDADQRFLLDLIKRQSQSRH